MKRNLHKKSLKGSVFGGAFLITGSCIGAGMLGLPIITGLSGFFPSLFMFFVAFVFMTATAFYLVEINSWFQKPVNLLSMLDHSLGKWGKWTGWVLYLFLFYALLIAYVAASGNLVSSFFSDNFGMQLPDWLGSSLLVLLFGWIVYLGTRSVDFSNRFLMFFKIGSFFFILFLGLKEMRTELLFRSAPAYAVYAIPILVISFGFHNMIPSLMRYMHGDVYRVRQSIIWGSFLTLLLYLAWQTVVLGIVPLEGKSGILDSLKTGEEASQALSGILGGKTISYFASIFAFFAILTSFLAQSLSLSHFFSDGLKLDYHKHESLITCLFTLLPPWLLAMLYPEIFFKALNFAGGFCAVLLFGILPLIMIYRGRYQKKILAPYRVWGGRALMLPLFLFALFVFAFQISEMLQLMPLNLSH